VSVCVGVSFVGFGLPAGAGLGLAPGAFATRAFLSPTGARALASDQTFRCS
jgi:hypothetical protein